MAGPILYVAEVDYGVEHQPAFEAWYSNRHAPDLLRFGSRTVSSYRPTVGGLKVFNVYQLADSEGLKTERYKSINAKDVYGADVRATSAGKERYQTLYQERAAAPTADDPVPLIDADWISVSRFDAPEGDDGKIAEWVRGEAQQMLAPQGWKRLRFATRIPESVGAGSNRPRCILFAEFAAEPPAGADLFAAVQKRFGATNSLPFIGYRKYPWPDVKR